MYGRAGLGGGQYAGSLRIAYRFETVSNSVVGGTTLRRRKLLQNGGLGQFEGWGWNVRRWYRSTQAKIQKFGGGGFIIVPTACKPHALESMGAPVVRIDDLDAGGSLRPYKNLYRTLRRSLGSSFVVLSTESTTRENPAHKKAGFLV